ncbi:hypothetical protein BLNAU_17649 [Blattamonas nauphoetae]|uniref:Uncharacterized protein n=1 Tax=Blattamonas nauphoetae TaxID=2049346 RepID=A0ABQ9X727_9EUKA|nr:hypothetical protein BLNAU_17649 [Blattamonas nauphoetae]
MNQQYSKDSKNSIYYDLSPHNLTNSMSQTPSLSSSSLSLETLSEILQPKGNKEFVTREEFDHVVLPLLSRIQDLEIQVKELQLTNSKQQSQQTLCNSSPEPHQKEPSISTSTQSVSSKSTVITFGPPPPRLDESPRHIQHPRPKTKGQSLAIQPRNTFAANTTRQSNSPVFSSLLGPQTNATYSHPTSRLNGSTSPPVFISPASLPFPSSLPQAQLPTSQLLPQMTSFQSSQGTRELSPPGPGPQPALRTNPRS